MTDLVLDPDDGRDLGHPMPKPVFPSPLKPEPVLHLIADPDGSLQRAMGDSLNNAIQQMYTDYQRKVVERAEELAGYGFGLAEIGVGTVADPDNPNVMRIRGTYRIVPLDADSVPRPPEPDQQ